jgi:hypothetical protein
MTPLERRVKIALGAGLTAPAIKALERMNTELARSRVILLSSVRRCGHYAIGRDKPCA